MSVNCAEAVATVTAEALTGMVLVLEDDDPAEIEVSLAEVALTSAEVPVAELEDRTAELVEVVSIEDEGVVEDEEEPDDDAPLLEAPDAVATWEASESRIDFKIADGIHVVSELE